MEAADAMRIDVVSLFPEFVSQMAGHGVVGRARARGLLSVHGWNPRDYADGSYRRVDERPFGGGPGMVMLIDPLLAVLNAARESDPRPARVFYMSPQGAPLTQAKARVLAGHERLILLCGRYEGVDERLLQAEVDEELSIGDYVLSGGELAAAVVIDGYAAQALALMLRRDWDRGDFRSLPALHATAGTLARRRSTRAAVWQSCRDRALAAKAVFGANLAAAARSDRS
mgnify:CR=1 FL=1